MACQLRGVRVTHLRVDTDYGRVGFENGSGVAYAFIAYAGPWAEARAKWTEPTIDDDTLDAAGRSFTDRVASAFRSNTSDWANYEQEMGGDVSVADAGLSEMFGWDFVWPPMTLPDPAWDAELEARWPEIQEMAARMLAGEQVIAFGSNEPLLRQP
jgi:hypothetical protein